MSEVEKLYENAMVEKITLFKPKHSITLGDYDEEYIDYPPFTAEKQIELIKLLGNLRDYTVEIDKFKGVYYVGCRSAGSNDKLWGSSNIFEDALAELINETWFCLTEEHKQQIREILE